MHKRFLSVILACILVSSMAVFAAAETTQTEWVEDFSGYTDSDFATGSSLYHNMDDTICSTSHHRSIRHIELKNDWVIRESNNDSTLDKFEIESGRGGNANTDQSLKIVPHSIYPHYYIENLLNNTPVDVSNGKAVGFSFDWWNDAGSYNNNKFANHLGYVYMTVVLSDGTNEVEKTINLATIYDMKVCDPFGENWGSMCLGDAWNGFDVYVSNNTIKMRPSSVLSEKTFNISNYDVSTEKFGTSTASEYSIKTVKKVGYQMYRNSGNNSSAATGGFDNFKVCVVDAMPESIETRLLPYYTDFTGFGHKLDSVVESVNIIIRDMQGSNITKDFLQFALYANTASDSTGVITMQALRSDDSERTTTINESRTLKNGHLKISNAQAATLSTDPYAYVRTDTSTTARAALGDKVQYSYDVKYKGNASAKSDNCLLRLHANLATGGGNVIYLAGDGTLYDPADGNPLAKLKADTFYSIDIMCDLTSDGTVATVYLDGTPLVTKTLTTEWENFADKERFNHAFRFTYVCEAGAESYLENAVWLDNICYQIFEDGTNAFDFDKSTSKSNVPALAKADVDFVNGTIFPVSADVTVEDLAAAGIDCTVLESDKETVVTDGSIAGKVLKFTGDYGKDVYYTVSSNGGANVTEDGFVTIRKNLGADLAASANVGDVITAKAVKGTSSAKVIIAEYNGSTLAGVKMGDTVANYKAKEAGNKIRVFIWDGISTLVPVFDGYNAELTVAE